MQCSLAQPVFASKSQARLQAKAVMGTASVLLESVQTGLARVQTDTVQNQWLSTHVEVVQVGFTAMVTLATKDLGVQTGRVLQEGASNTHSVGIATLAVVVLAESVLLDTFAKTMTLTYVYFLLERLEVQIVKTTFNVLLEYVIPGSVQGPCDIASQPLTSRATTVQEPERENT